MKKLAFSAITLGLTTLLVGCDKYDVQIPKVKETREYYVANPDKAKEALKECEKTFDQIYKADSGLSPEEHKEFRLYLAKHGESEYRKHCNDVEYAIREVEELERQKQDELQKAERRKEAIAYIEKLEKEFVGKTWQESISKIINSGFDIKFYSYKYKEFMKLDLNEFLQKSLMFHYIEYSHDGNPTPEQYRDDIKNDVIPYIYAKQRELGIKELLSKPYNELINDSSYCKTDKREYSVCEIWTDAVQQQRNNVVNGYMANYEQLKTDYNQCVAKFEDYLKSINVGKNDKVDNDIYKNIIETEKKIYESYPCAETEEALQKLNLKIDHYEKLD